MEMLKAKEDVCMSHNENEEVKIVIENIVKGINPITGEQIAESSLLNDARIIRCLYYLVEILQNKKRRSERSSKTKEFIITPEQKGMLAFPPEKIGIAVFSRCINDVLDPNVSKKVTGIVINKKLKKLGILSEEKTQDGHTRTIINEKSIEYGFESKRKSFNGTEYDQVLINDDGKKYLLENIEMLMEK
jgi:hypothetical protein